MWTESIQPQVDFAKESRRTRNLPLPPLDRFSIFPTEPSLPGEAMLIHAQCYYCPKLPLNFPRHALSSPWYLYPLFRRRVQRQSLPKL
jgi:hypothetical protein